MTKRIFYSIFLAAIGVFLAAVLLFLFVLYDYFSDVSRSQLRTEAELAAKAVSDEGTTFFDGLKADNYRITLISSDGSVLFDSTSNADKMENHSEREEFKQAVSEGFGESSRYSATLTERYFYCAKLLPDGNILRLSASHNSQLTLIMGMGGQICAILAVAAVLSAVLASRLSKRIAKPLSELDLDDPLNNDCYEELSPLLKKIDVQQKKIHKQTDELTRKKVEFETITNGMSEGLILLNNDGAILSANSSAARILGFDKNDRPKDILSVDRDLKLSELLKNTRNGEYSQMNREFNGRKYQFGASPVKSDNGVSGMVLLLLDITEKEQSEQLRREFTANVSHELKTPLQTISGCSELLKNGMVKPEDISEFSEKIYSESQRMVRLIEDIIKLSRLDEGAFGMEWENADLYALSGEVIKSLSDTANSAEVTLKLVGEPSVIHGIPQLLQTLIFNLCDNAIKYNHKGGSVEISVKNENNFSILTVSDTGIGIPPEHTERIFERFYRVDKSRSRAGGADTMSAQGRQKRGMDAAQTSDPGGTGPGLSIVKHAAKIHNAEIKIDSTVGKGTTITVIFPQV